MVNCPKNYEYLVCPQFSQLDLTCMLSAPMNGAKNVLEDGDTIIYNATTGKWEFGNAKVNFADGIATSINGDGSIATPYSVDVKYDNVTIKLNGSGELYVEPTAIDTDTRLTNPHFGAGAPAGFSRMFFDLLDVETSTVTVPDYTYVDIPNLYPSDSLTNTLSTGHLVGTHTASDGIIEDIYETITTITGTVTGHLIGIYTNEDGVAQNINETVTKLESDGEANLSFTDENGGISIIDVTSEICATNTDLSCLPNQIPALAPTDNVSLAVAGKVTHTALNGNTDVWEAGLDAVNITTTGTCNADIGVNNMVRAVTATLVDGIGKKTLNINIDSASEHKPVFLSSGSNVPFAFNINMPIGYILGPANASLVVTNTHPCRTLRGIYTVNEINTQATGQNSNTFDVQVNVSITTTSISMPTLNYNRRTSVSRITGGPLDSETQHESTRQYILDDIPPGGSQTFSISTSTEVISGSTDGSQYIYSQITFVGQTL